MFVEGLFFGVILVNKLREEIIELILSMEDDEFLKHLKLIILGYIQKITRSK